MIKCQNACREAVGILTVEKVADQGMVWGRLSTKTGKKAQKVEKPKGRCPKLSIMGSFGSKIGFVIVDNFPYRK